MDDTQERIPETPPQSSEQLVQWLDDARRRTIELTADLDGSRRFGPKMDIVNPPIWELGHVGFFHDYFALRKLHRLNHYQHPNADRLYDSSTIEHDMRWALPFPDMEATLGYLQTVRDAMVERLPAGQADPAISYVYQLTTLHEDMHAEAFTYTRQTLGYPAPNFGSLPELPELETGPLPGDVAIPGGEHLLGSAASVPFRFDNEKPTQVVEVAPFSIARAPVTNDEFKAFVEDGGYARRELWREEGWKWLNSPASRRRPIGSATRAATGSAGASTAPNRCRRTSRSATSVFSRPRLTAAGPGVGCRPRPNGKSPPVARLMAAGGVLPTASATGPGETNRPIRRAPISTAGVSTASTWQPSRPGTAPSAAGR